MDCLLNDTPQEIQQKLTPLGLEPWRAKQVFLALQQGKKFEEMTTLSLPVREQLTQQFLAQPVTVVQTKTSTDGTVKFLFGLPDNHMVEGVLMQYKFGNTLCISTQVGCAMGCLFCASTLDGLVRNLTAGEMLGQVVTVNRWLSEQNKSEDNKQRNITNVVLMGSGEPLANYEQVTKFFDLVTHPDGLNISQRNISLSTCGLVEKIKKLADDGYKVTLSVSLHAPTDTIRAGIMKIAQRYTIAQLLDACRYYYEKTKRRLQFEYILISGVNNSPKDAATLAQLLKNFQAHINLIPLNEVAERNLKTVSRNNAYQFLRVLQERGLDATIRRTLGDDIEGACGQLRRSYLQEQNSKKSD